MSRRPVAIVASVLAVLLVGLVFYRTVDATFLSLRRDLIDQIDKAQAAIEKSRNRVKGRPALDRRIQSYADRTLGASREEVDARLRERLNRIAEAVGIESATVGTGAVSTKQSPARRAFPRSASWRKLREETDFVELTGWLAGQGSLAQIVRIVDQIEAEPWVKRVDQLKLDPKDNGERFGFTVRLTTLFLPGLEPAEADPAPYDAGRLEHFASLTTKNPFRVPEAAPAPPSPVAAAPAPPAQPAGFPYGQWIVTGVARNQAGEEVWLRNAGSGETRRLAVGEKIGEAVFSGTKDDAALFKVADRLFMVPAGRNLNERLAVNP